MIFIKKHGKHLWIWSVGYPRKDVRWLSPIGQQTQHAFKMTYNNMNFFCNFKNALNHEITNTLIVMDVIYNNTLIRFYVLRILSVHLFVLLLSVEYISWTEAYSVKFIPSYHCADYRICNRIYRGQNRKAMTPPSPKQPGPNWLFFWREIHFRGTEVD